MRLKPAAQVTAVYPPIKLKKKLGECRRRPLVKVGVDDPVHAGSARREAEALIAIRQRKRRAG